MCHNLFCCQLFWRLSWWRAISLGFYHYARETSPSSCPGVPPLPCQRPGSVWFKGRPTFSLQSTAWTSKLLPSTQSEFLFIFNYFYLLQSWSSLCCEESLQMWKSISSRWYHDFLRGTAACVHTSLEIILWNGSLFVSSCNLIQHTLELQLLLGYIREKFVIPLCTSHCVLLL